MKNGEHYTIEQLKVSCPKNQCTYSIKTDPNLSAFAMFIRLIRSPQIKAAAQSTSQAEADLNKKRLIVSLIKLLYKGRTPQTEKSFSDRPFNFYARVYQVSHTPIPGLKELKQALTAFARKVANPNRIWIADYAPIRGNNGQVQLVPTLVDRYIDLNNHLPIFQFILKYKQAYEEAANTLHASHPDISKNTLLTFLMINTFQELFWIGTEDPWQDRGAAKYYQSPHAQNYEKHYQAFKKKGAAFGVRIDGKVYEIPWSLASNRFGVKIELQGLGPNQIIIGDLVKTAQFANGTLWKKYFPTIFPTIGNAVKIALDPQQSVKAVALMYDIRIRELKETIASNPRMRMPQNVYPTIPNDKTSRELFLLSWVRYCKAFPEVVVRFPNYFPYAHHSWNIEFMAAFFKTIQRIMQIPDSLPHLQMRLIPSRDAGAVDYFDASKNPRNTDSLMAIIIPK